MKKLLFAIICSSVFLNCEKKECCTIIDAFADISVIETGTAKDLLNQSEANHYDIKEVKLEFSTDPNQKRTIASINRSQPLFFQKDNRYYLRIFPTTYESIGDEHTVKIYWNDTDIDLIKFRLNHQKQNIFTDKIFVNETLAWDISKGYRSITIQK